KTAKAPAEPSKTVHPIQPALSAPRAPALPRVPSRVSGWVPVAVAAGVLLCVTAGSFAFFNNQNSKNLVKSPWLHSLPAPQDAPTAVPAPAVSAPHTATGPDPNTVVRSFVTPVPPLPMPKEVLAKGVPIAPEPRLAPIELHASPILPKVPPFDFIQVRVPFL